VIRKFFNSGKEHIFLEAGVDRVSSLQQRLAAPQAH